MLLGAPAAQDKADPVQQFLPRLQLVLVDEVLGEPEGTLGPGDDGHLEERVSALQEPGHYGMPALVVGYGFPLLHGDEALSLDAADDSFRGQLEVDHLDYLFAMPGRKDCSLVAQVGNLGPAEAWCQRCESAGVVLHSVLGR